MSVAPEIIAALISAAGGMGASAIGHKTDSPGDQSAIMDWTYPGGNHESRPSYNEGGKAFQFMSSHFKKPSSDVPEDRKVYDDNGRLLGWFADAGSAKTGFEAKGFTTRDKAVKLAKMSPYQMNRGTEGEMWLGQRENLFRQDMDFSKREAANQLSIRGSTQPESLRLDRQQALYDYGTANSIRSQNQRDTQDLAIQNWNWQKSNAGTEGAAFRARMQAQYPGASTWDLLSGGTASGAGPGSVPGIPGMPPPSAGTQRSGPDPAVVAAKLNSNSSAMQTIANAKIAQQQMATQENIAKRQAVIDFMNTAIQGAKTPSDIMSRAAAAKLAAAQTSSEAFRPGVLHEQASNLATDTVLKDAQIAKTRIEAENARTGTMVNKLRNNAGDLKDYLGSVIPDLVGELENMFKSFSVRGK